MRLLLLFSISFLLLLSVPQANFAGSPPATNQLSLASVAPKPPKTKKLHLLEEVDKLGAVIGYFGIVGFLISFLGFYKKTPSDFLKFHLKQGFGNALLAIILPTISRVLSYFLGNIPGISWLFWALSLWPLINLIIGIMNALKGEMKLLPLIGKFFDEHFNFIK